MNHSILMNMVGLVLIAVAIFALSAMLKKFSGLPYKRQPHLLSPAERAFFLALDAAVSERFVVFAKVRIADLVAVASAGDRRSRTIALNRIAAKHVDFVLCKRGSLEVVCAVELDDSTHDAGDRRQRDRFVNSVFSHVQIPLARIPVKERYGRGYINSAIDVACGITEVRPVTSLGAVIPLKKAPASQSNK